MQFGRTVALAVVVLGFAVWICSLGAVWGGHIFSWGYRRELGYTIAATDPGFGERGFVRGSGGSGGFHRTGAFSLNYTLILDFLSMIGYITCCVDTVNKCNNMLYHERSLGAQEARILTGGPWYCLVLHLYIIIYFIKLSFAHFSYTCCKLMCTQS